MSELKRFEGWSTGKLIRYIEELEKHHQEESDQKLFAWCKDESGYRARLLEQSHTLHQNEVRGIMLLTIERHLKNIEECIAEGLRPIGGPPR